VRTNERGAEIMKYSYIKPKRKTPLTNEVILIISFFSISFLMLLSTYLFLLYKDYRFNDDLNFIQNRKEKLQTSIKSMKSSIKAIEEEENLANEIFTTNSVLKDSISNLFDLVPDRIILSRAKLLKNGLILYGITPNKETYEYMLDAPLRSIFSKNYTSFYKMQNGWMSFVSSNYLDNDSLGDEDEN
jgi:hypothetical protein